MPIVHSVGVATGVGTAVGIGAVIVRQPSELIPALAQHQKPVVIEDPRIAERFRSVQGWQEARMWVFGSLIAAMAAFAIAKEYKLELSWHRDWKVQTMDGKITLTPVQRQ
jgi:hypothetical protein